MQINDLIFKSLEREGYAGGVDDKLSAWLKFEGANGNHLDDLWASFYTIKLIPAGALSDRKKTWLAGEGFTQPSTDDADLDYWQTRFNTP